MAEVIITVRGEHETRLVPEHGVAHVTVRTDGPARGAVVERIAALATPVRDDLTARQAASSIVEWSSQRASVWSERPWNNEGKQLAPVHHASVDFTATFSDFAALSWWISELADREGVQVNGVEWRLTPATRATVEREVASEAVRVAVVRATAYADAIGLVSVKPLEIADLGLLSHNEQGPSPAPKMMRAMAVGMMDSAGGSPAMQFEPEDIVVSAGVEARFVAS